MTNPAELIERLESTISGYGASSALVAFSGGVDSATTLALGARALGREAVTAVTAVSPSYATGELEAARELAALIGVEHRTVDTGEVEREAYARNDAMRCFHCKAELYTVLARLVSETAREGTVVIAGANADDKNEFRPGLLAADRFGVRNPLLEVGVGKREVRAIARRLGLTVSEKPALACLSSRVAFGIRITPDLLARIDRAEAMVRSLGFETVRVRHRGDVATIEVEPTDVGRLEAHSGLSSLLADLRDLGWRDARVDPAGYLAGSMNATLFVMPTPIGAPGSVPA
jgi:pyridinium-3,5-biscarboxylic acid mononucleotide sulfurtransferase